jgi:diguanylate cyclase (GGDEF)-like protein
LPTVETPTGEFTANLESLDMLNTVMQRDYFVTRLGQELAFCDRHRTYMCIVHLRMLGSEELIDQFGQPVFAALVRTMAHEIDKKTRAEDSVAYLGGAGFALQLPVTNGIGAQGVLSRLMEKLSARRLRYHGTYISVSFCAGLYVRTTRDSSSVDQIMEELEKRVELAQKMGSGQIVSSASEEEPDYSVEQALNKLRYDQVEGLDKQLSRLLDEVKPLLRFARDHDEIGFEDLLESIKDDDPD